jgi:hypothetical protein
LAQAALFADLADATTTITKTTTTTKEMLCQ